MSRSKFPRALAAAGLAAVLVGCGGGSSVVQESDQDPTLLMPQDPDVRRKLVTAEAAAKTAVEAVTDTASAAEVTAAEEAVTALETALANAADLSAEDTDVASARERLTTLTESLADAKASRMTAIEEMEAAEMAEQRTAITAAVTAAKTAVDALTSTSTNDEVTAADAAIAALETALRNGTALSEDDIDVDIALSDLAALKSSLGIVKASRTTAMEAAETAEQGRQRTAIMDAVTAVRTAVEAVTDTASDAEVTAAEAAVAALETALANAEGLSADDTDVASAQGRLTMLKKSLDTAKDSRIEAQRTEIKTAVTAARTAVDAVTDDANDAVVKEAEDAVAALETAIENGTGLSEGDTDVASAQGTLTTLKGFLAIARTSRMTALQEREEAAEMAQQERREEQRTAITAAVTAARTAVDAVTDTTEPEVVTAAEDAVAALETAIENGTDLAADDTEVVSAQGTLTMLEASLATAKASRMTAMEAQEMVNMAIETAKAAQATAQRRVDALDNYSTSVDQQVAEDALVALRNAYEALPGAEEEADDADKETYQTYKTAYDTLNAALQQKKEDQAALIQRNNLASQWISAIDRWDDSIDDNTVNLNLAPFLDVRTPMPADVVDTEDYLSTEIRAFRSNGTTEFIAQSVDNTPTGWTAHTFQTDIGQSLKIFTNHGGAETIFSETWQEFRGANNNSNYFTSNDYNYYKDAFGDPNVEFSTNQNGNQAIKVLTTKEGLSSAIHVSDIDIKIAGESITLSSTTPLRLDSLAGPAAFTFGELKGEIQNLTVSLFGQNISQPFCAQTQPPDNILNNSASACEVTLNPDGHLVVKGDTEKGYLNFTTTGSANDLASQQVVLERPDTRYTVMGYWMDEEGDSYNIDTFATARYGPAGETGVADNIGSLAGSATYSGDAVGVYVMNKGDEINMDLHDGEFEATISLTADFNVTDDNNDGGFTVSGTIDNFMSLTDSESERDDLADWTLILKDSTKNYSNGSFSGYTAAESPLGDDAKDRRWQGQFYGRDNLDTEVTTDDHPLAAVGDFSGDFGNSNRVVGVFSAEKE